MHWQEACLKSKRSEAIRHTPNGRIMIRRKDGSGAIRECNSNKFRERCTGECLGYTDWEPR